MKGKSVNVEDMNASFSLSLREKVASLIRDVPDFPQAGVLYRDITPLLADGDTFSSLIKEFAQLYEGKIDAVAGLDARGFILASPIAAQLGVGMIAVRKAGSLPGPVIGTDYSLEYGTARFELHDFTVKKNQRILIVDDVLATGGTAGAAVQLIERAGADVAGLCFLLELKVLKGREGLLGDYDVQSLCVL